MARLHPVHDIQLSDDLRFTRTSWIAERAGWAGLFGIVAAALLGALGPGLLSTRTVATPDGLLVVTCGRFGNFRTDDALTVRIAARGDFWIDQSFLDDVAIRAIRPEPAGVRTLPGRTVYTFSDAATVRIEFAPQKPGRLSGRFGLGEAIPVQVGQFVYP